jgi:hypothetical protein
MALDLRGARAAVVPADAALRERLQKLLAREAVATAWSIMTVSTFSPRMSKEAAGHEHG